MTSKTESESQQPNTIETQLVIPAKSDAEPNYEVSTDNNKINNYYCNLVIINSKNVLVAIIYNYNTKTLAKIFIINCMYLPVYIIIILQCSSVEFSSSTSISLHVVYQIIL